MVPQSPDGPVTVLEPKLAPKAPLFVWLRGETDGRATKVNP
jgi:hypothetical protein